MKCSIFLKRKRKGPFELSNEKMIEFENADGKHRNNGISGRRKGQIVMEQGLRVKCKEEGTQEGKKWE